MSLGTEKHSLRLFMFSRNDHIIKRMKNCILLNIRVGWTCFKTFLSLKLTTCQRGDMTLLNQCGM